MARDLGARKIAVDSLVEIVKRVEKTRGVDIGEPFLAPGPRFDSLAPGAEISHWVIAGVLEELERLSTHSSYFVGNAARDRLVAISQLGFGSDEMRRRMTLVEERFG